MYVCKEMVIITKVSSKNKLQYKKQINNAYNTVYIC